MLGNGPYFVYKKKNLILGCNNKFWVIKNERIKIRYIKERTKNEILKNKGIKNEHIKKNI